MRIDLPDTPPLPHDSLFGVTPLPDWVEGFHPFQWDIIQAGYEELQIHNALIIQAPTGIGKSLVGETLRRLLVTNGTYCCTSKALQDQFVKDFPYGKVIKGRSNYLTESGPMNELGGKLSTNSTSSAITCADCTWNEQTSSCRWCRTTNFCPYVMARNRAASAELSILNSSYLLTDINLGAGLFQGRGLTILDEADMLESELLNYTSVEITPYRLRKLSLGQPKRKTVEQAWVDWLEFEAIPAVTHYRNSLPPLSEAKAQQAIREIKYTQGLLDKLYMLREELPKGNWVFDGEGDKVIFRPVFTAKYGSNLLWKHNKRPGLPDGKFILMSATILSPDLLADELGLGMSWGFVDVDSPFPVENRPVHVVPVTDMSFKNRVNGAWDEMVKGVEGVLRLHPNDRVLIHTVSYSLARHIKEGLKLSPSPPTENSRRPIITYDGSDGKDWALREYKKHPNSVLVAPSMDRGIDLPGDLCRAQIIAKVPFPNTQDKRIAARMHRRNGSAWYAAQTVRTIMQMTGRPIRSVDDHAVTYILDSQFASNLWVNHKHLFPKYWRDALNWKFNKNLLLSRR